MGESAPFLTFPPARGLTREAVDAAVAARVVCELPSAVACTYMLSATDFAVGLTAVSPVLESAQSSGGRACPALEVTAPRRDDLHGW